MGCVSSTVYLIVYKKISNICVLPSRQCWRGQTSDIQSALVIIRWTSISEFFLICYGIVFKNQRYGTFVSAERRSIKRKKQYLAKL